MGRTVGPPCRLRDRVHELGAAVAAAALLVSAAVDYELGGVLWPASVAVAALLACSASRSGRAASSVCIGIGATLLGASTAYLMVLAAEANPIGLQFMEVMGVLLATTVLLLLGSYGRLSAGLGPDGSFVRPAKPADAERMLDPDSAEDDLVRAEIAMAEGHPTPDQELLLMADGSKAHRARRHVPACRTRYVPGVGNSRSARSRR